MLRYSTEQHGCSLHTLYRQNGRAGPTVLVVLDANGAVFGGFATERWAPAHRYFGTGESFLFRVHTPNASPGRAQRPFVSFYPWTGANTHFQLASHDSLAMGGGGHFGLWLDEALEYGSSNASQTYGNAPLGSEESFRVIRVEVWELAIAEPQLSPRVSETSEGLASPRREQEHDLSPPVLERASRQGSSAFLVQLLSPMRGRRD